MEHRFNNRITDANYNELKDMIIDLRKEFRDELKETKDDLKNEINKLDESINGNGKPGIKADVVKLGTNLENLEKNNNNKNNTFWKYATLSVGVLALFLSVIK